MRFLVINKELSEGCWRFHRHGEVNLKQYNAIWLFSELLQQNMC